MRWKAPSERTQLWLLLPIIAPVFLTGIIVIVATSPIWFSLHRYYKWQDSRGWHRWFAWRPVRIWRDERGDLVEQWFWLETIERRRPYYGHDVYRAIEARQQ